MLLSILPGLRSHILHDADDGGAGGGAQDPEKTNADGGGASSAVGTQAEEKRTFTQSELNAMFADRAKQAKQSGVAELLKELGVENADAIKKVLKDAEKAKKDQMTELEKAQAEAADYKAKIEAAEAARLDTEAKAAEKLLRAAVIAEATKQGFHNPADAWLYIDKTSIKPKDDDYEGIDKAIEAVVKSRPYLAKAQQQTPSRGTPTRAQKPAPGAAATPPARKLSVRL